MRAYKVGGAVRDRLLGRVPRDADYVVVGATPAAMLAEGYKQVGADFPVFLHPETKEEYALARTERKRGRGHKGFAVDAAPTVTLEEDLMRRDFTVNAMAEEDDGRLIDPHQGRRDISLRRLRHVSEAFAEDPLRVLRAARFAAELDFIIDGATEKLMAEMVAAGALAELAPERIWMELRRGLASLRPRRMFECLRACGALAAVLPEVDALFGVEQDPKQHPEGCAGTHTMMVLTAAAANSWPWEYRWAALLHDVGKALTPAADLPRHPGHEERGAELAAAACARLRVPKKAAAGATVATREHGLVHGFAELEPEDATALLGRAGAWRTAGQLECLLAVCDCDHSAHPDLPDVYQIHPQRELIEACVAAVAELDLADVASKGEGAKAEADARRRAAVAKTMAEWRG
ncbi:MAG: multifunctional CCA addition/repair protein [Betaproteobacteria bacterium AqS2]|uniref:Multifunctional CCA addition/repair protein n=1 Tax=Candidatus Amphirhobacter heronislandensis TaxID=1732024 RepID=A0A930UGI3_9GAMM|nr:multifunctional CCA addition/repair protein [Betaproteobacteria bacterium AqS2]